MAELPHRGHGREVIDEVFLAPPPVCARSYGYGVADGRSLVILSRDSSAVVLLSLVDKDLTSVSVCSECLRRLIGATPRAKGRRDSDSVSEKRKRLAMRDLVGIFPTVTCRVW